jgi:hypothetical protein
MHMPQMDSVKESYRGCVTFVLRYGYGHLVVVWSAKVVKIRGQKEFFGSKLCKFGFMEYFCTRMKQSAMGR